MRSCSCRTPESEELTATPWEPVPPGLVFVNGAGAKQPRTELHLDVAPHTSDDRDAEIARLKEMGATEVNVGQGPDVTWTVLADPGRRFCARRTDTSPSERPRCALNVEASAASANYVMTSWNPEGNDVDERTDAVDLDTDLIPRGEREVVARHDAGTGHQVRPRRKLVLAIEPVGEFEEITLDPGQFGGPGEHRRTVSFDGEVDRRSRRRQDVDHQSRTERRAVGVDLRLGQVERIDPHDRAARHVVADRVAEDPARSVRPPGSARAQGRSTTSPNGSARCRRARPPDGGWP